MRRTWAVASTEEVVLEATAAASWTSLARARQRQLLLRRVPLQAALTHSVGVLSAACSALSHPTRRQLRRQLLRWRTP